MFFWVIFSFKTEFECFATFFQHATAAATSLSDIEVIEL